MEKACRPASRPAHGHRPRPTRTAPHRGLESVCRYRLPVVLPAKGPRSAAPDRIRQGANELPPSCTQWPLPACPRSKRASPPASQQRHDPSSSSVSSGQLCGASGAGAFSPLPPVVRAPSEGMSALSPPGGSPPRDMTSFTLGTMSPPPARSATACAMGLRPWPSHRMVCPTHYDAYSLRCTHCALTCVMVLNLRPRGDT